MAQTRYFDPSQPQTLQIATILLYIEAAFGLLAVIAGGGGLAVLFIAAYGAGAYGMANEKKWGYQLATVAASLRLVLSVLHVIGLHGLFGFVMLPTGAIIDLIFAIALVALLVHEQSREYQRIWFS